MVKVWLLSLIAVVFGAAVAANGQEAEAAPSPYFDCPYINYFDSDCPQLRELWREREQRRLQEQGGPAATPGVEPEPGQTDVHVGQDDGAADPLDLEKLYPLFPKDSMAPDAPDLYRLLLARPSLETARLYVRWYARRTARLQEVEALIKLAGGELEADIKAGKGW